MTLDKKEKKEACLKFFYELVEELKDTHELVGSCNADETLYLIPKGTIDQLTYTSKPENSYRFSDHWNWYANIRKCQNERYIQCLNTDLPWAKKRIAPGKPSKPIFGICVAKIGDDSKYHTIFGEVFNRKTKKWSFIG